MNAAPSSSSRVLRVLPRLIFSLALASAALPALADVDSASGLAAASGASGEASGAPSTPTAAATPAASPLAPRAAYNAALEALARGDAAAAERGFADARDRAGADAELRFRSAFNLASALALAADGLEREKPEEAIAALRRAAAWLRDAIRQRPEDADARANLEIVLLRVRALADALSKGKDGIEPRLERLIADERGLRDDARALAGAVRGSGAAAEPAAFEERFRAASAWQRTLLGEAGTLAQMVAEEAGKLEAKKEGERADAERIRLFQLRGVEAHLERARQRMADARSALGRLEAEAAHRKTDAAVRELLRVKEALADPLAALRSALADQVEVTDGARALVRAARATLSTATPTAEARAPAWLTTAWLAEREAEVRERAAEVRLRLEAGVSSPAAASATAHPPATAEDRETVRLLAAAREALPHLLDADRRLASAAGALDGGRPAEAAGPAAEAVLHLARALERFSGARALIEIAHGDQAGVVALLTPPGEEGALEGHAALPTEERARRAAEAVSRNAERLARLEGLLADDLAALEERAAAPGAPTASAEEASRERERYRLAGEERRAAAAALARLEEGLRAPEGPPILPPAREALARIEALRRLFFTLVEHLEDLAREEAKAREEAAGAATETDAPARARALGPVASGEARRAALGREVAKALRAQAQDARAAPARAAGPSGADAGRRLEQAGEETEKAAAAMEGAAAEAARPAAEVEPVLEEQREALEHLATAIHLLRPPPPEDQQQQGDEQQDAQGHGERKRQEERAVSREQAERRLQAVRDREAERQREKRRRGQAAPEPVERDW